MSGEIATLSIKVDASDVPRAGSAMDQMAASSSKLENGIKALVGVWATWQLSGHIKDLALIGARYETLGVAMTQVGLNAGFTSSQMAAFQSQLQATGISAIESRNNLARMAAAQLDLSKSAELARVAQDAAVLGDINSSEAFERLVQGIVSGQPRILHTMGIFADFMGAEKKWADAHGETIETMSQEEKVTARFNATLEEGAKRAGVYEAAMGTAGKQIKSMERFIQDLEVQFGKTMGEALTFGVAKFTTGVKDATQAMDEWEKSGGQGVFAMKLKNDLSSLTESLIGTTAWLFKHRDAVATLVGAYAGFRLSGMIAQTWEWCVVQKTAVASHVAATAAAYNEATATTKAALAKAGFIYKTNESNMAQIAEAQTMLVHNALAVQSAVAAGAMTETEAALAKEELARTGILLEQAAAQNGANAAMAAGSTLMGGLSGGLTLLVTALGAAIAAWMMFDQTTSSKSKDSAQFMDERIRSAQEQMDKIKRFWEGIGKGKSAGRAETDSWSALDDPASHKGMEVIRDAQKELADAEAAFRNTLGRAEKSMTAAQAVGYGKSDDSSSRRWDAAQRVLTAQKEYNDALAHEQKLVETLNNLHAQTDYKEKFLANENLKNKALKATSVTGASGEDTTTEYGREIQRLQEETLKLTLNEREALKLKLQLMDNSSGGDVSKALGIYDLNESLKAQIKHMDEVYDAETKDYNAYQALQKQLKDVTASSNEYAEAVRLIGKFEGDAEVKARMLKEAWSKFTPEGKDLERYQKSLKQEADKINKPYGDERQRLEDMRSGGLISEEVYIAKLKKVERAELQLRAESGKTWAIIANVIDASSDSASDAMTRWMNNTDGLGRSWTTLGSTVRNVLRDMVVQMQKAVMQQQLMQPFMSWISSGISNWGNGFSWGGGVTSGGTYSGGYAGFDTGFDIGAASGGYRSGDRPYWVGENGPEIFNPGVSGSITPNHAIGGQTVNAPITIVVQSDGTTTAKGGDGAQNMKALGQMMAAKCREVIVDESRSGGLLARA